MTDDLPERPYPAAEPATGPDAAPPTNASSARSRLRSGVEWIAVIGGALVVALIIRTFLLGTFYIPSASMEPTLMVGDRVFVTKVGYDIGHGDIVVFDRPGGAGPDGIDVLIKRVVGLPGDEIEGRDGTLYRNGEPLEEDYLTPGTSTSTFGPVTVPDDHLWMMGDNRGRSQDSRVFGPVPEDTVVGEAFLIFWPLGDFGRL